ncbi:hypothetical protein [Bacillus horti]|uniref:D-arabinose 1-dehydrogenase-like Zn-dependent alcohol dehydrogenase n=1 Tax=Caldalkalibacillus horti TaxID=77523 RepID=A0ABT9W0V5_9BACI|nr:hypothetical protein [Bacillus horti]MDQ0166841.1 D-arabinose 1-dehydrogenase-like Zn-dependent alcohol dehydrogenase [Bacillus horti]
MVVEIHCAHTQFYYEFSDDLAEQAYELQLEFDEWLRNVEGNHPFKQYWEMIDPDGTISFAGYVNSFGPDEFVAWLNIEKFKDEVAKAIDLPDFPASVSIYF